MRHKSELTSIFITFKTQIKNLTSHKIKNFRTDGGTEYTNDTLKNFLQTHGITHQMSFLYTPQHNEVAERKHRHIIETTRTLLHMASVPYKHGPDAVLTAVHLINRMPSITTANISPFQLMHNFKSDYSLLRTFGCECFSLLPHHTRHKLQPKVISCVFLGYSDIHKGYKCLDSTTNKIIVS